MIKVIPTKYNGTKFRSRLEARWAIFFDEAKIRWKYEPLAVRIPGLYYIPDFQAFFSILYPNQQGITVLPPKWHTIEIKPDRWKDTPYFEKANKKMADYVIEHGKRLILAVGTPFNRPWSPHITIYSHKQDSLMRVQASFGSIPKKGPIHLYVYLTVKYMANERSERNYLPVTFPWYEDFFHEARQSLSLFKACYIAEETKFK